ncbi:transcriptional regulator with XRE-family HTH domain [Roseateles asaccharophilus]|uniref:hypothetical protein n=1 Tax=Roseateles asaccharophilus TaxID=582607 RepID=UPI0038353989
MHEINPNLQEAADVALKQIGRNIQRARKEGFHESREAFAKRIGCAPMTLDRIEAGDRGVAVVYLVAALAAVHVLQDAVNVTKPDLLIATQIPAKFPEGFEDA